MLLVALSAVCTLRVALMRLQWLQFPMLNVHELIKAGPATGSPFQAVLPEILTRLTIEKHSTSAASPLAAPGHDCSHRTSQDWSMPRMAVVAVKVPWLAARG